MAYTGKLSRELDRLKLKEGDRIRVVKGKDTFEGILMPQPFDSDHIALKLDNGYNIGIKFDKSVELTKSKTREPDTIEREYEAETKPGHSHPKLRYDKSKPTISILSTGGTIASKVDYRTGGVYASYTAEDMVATAPELKEIANIDSRLVFNIMSEDMTPKEWPKMVTETAKALNKGAVGAVITHGTDTMHFSSAALSFMLRGLGKPVVFTGAQRSSDRGSSDSFMNLVCSAHVAAKANLGEVCLCMHGSTNDEFCYAHRGTKVRKMHTSRRDAFKSVNDRPLLKVHPDGRMERVNKRFRERDDTKKVRADTKFEGKIALIKAYPGSDPGILDFHLSRGCKGFVIEGTGLGHVPTMCKASWIKPVKKLTSDGIPVVVAPQALYGRINPNVYSNLRRLYEGAGAIPGEDMLPETAYVKLGWVLAHAREFEEIQKMMLTDIAGEINPRLEE
jgi:glutamyl-tRNA(Gln) amidotransferase subunit D